MMLLFSIYREESSLVDQFVFEVLVIFVESLALAHSDEQSMGNNYSFYSCIWIICAAFYFLKRILNAMTFASLCLAEYCNA